MLGVKQKGCMSVRIPLFGNCLYFGVCGLERGMRGFVWHCKCVPTEMRHLGCINRHIDDRFCL